MQIETVPIAALHPHPRNPRVHPESALARIQKSIETYGWTNPVLVCADGTILAGHARVKTAQKMGLTEVPVLRLPLSGQLADAYLVADNRLAELTEWENEGLSAILTELTASLDDIEVTGFSADEVQALLDQFTEYPEEDPDTAIPEPPSDPITQPGDLWQLGRHRLLCGDSTKAEDWETLMGDDKATLIVTDPPYGVSFEDAKYNPRAKEWDGIAGDDRRGIDQRSFVFAVFSEMQKHTESATPVYCWSAPMAEGAATLAGLLDAGIHIQSQIVWVKNALVLGQADWQWRHEIAWYGWTPGTHHVWNGGRSETTVWEIDKDASAHYRHPMQKPVELYAKAMRASSAPETIVVDGFGGSGASLVAAEQEGRSMRVMELDPQYCDVIIQRWEQLTGQQAKKVTTT